MSKFKPTKIIIHCSDSNWGSAKVIDEWHRDRGFDEIGYHYVILNDSRYYNLNESSADGIVEPGRSIDIQGAHCLGRNHDSIGICLIGVDEFTPAQYKSLKELCERLMEEYGISSDDIYGHNEFSTKTCPNFSVDDFVEEYITNPSDTESNPVRDSYKELGNAVTDEEALDALYALRRFFKQ
tara:strand:- start:971 stop:1516 length:546 start_codon:yes stop_codon:yes gene_type:complete